MIIPLRFRWTTSCMITSRNPLCVQSPPRFAHISHDVTSSSSRYPSSSSSSSVALPSSPSRSQGSASPMLLLCVPTAMYSIPPRCWLLYLPKKLLPKLLRLPLPPLPLPPPPPLPLLLLLLWARPLSPPCIGPRGGVCLCLSEGLVEVFCRTTHSRSAPSTNSSSSLVDRPVRRRRGVTTVRRV